VTVLSLHDNKERTLAGGPAVRQSRRDEVGELTLSDVGNADIHVQEVGVHKGHVQQKDSGGCRWLLRHQAITTALQQSGMCPRCRDSEAWLGGCHKGPRPRGIPWSRTTATSLGCIEREVLCCVGENIRIQRAAVQLLRNGDKLERESTFGNFSLM